ncbi:hypothetical protein [Thermodesulforhabdus norvegica]|uniref:hypothetical protein n=1 Tax=Thermodesulforhabdus norvegica TaxID=39841 RepID=UPI0011607A42|nr:hypothetical protein [Thermodesulforhabdus norvegica]
MRAPVRDRQSGWKWGHQRLRQIPPHLLQANRGRLPLIELQSAGIAQLEECVEELEASIKRNSSGSDRPLSSDLPQRPHFEIEIIFPTFIMA